MHATLLIRWGEIATSTMLPIRRCAIDPPLENSAGFQNCLTYLSPCEVGGG
jgi:hypothetical protein